MQTAVITGATQGIGKSIAECFLKEGFAVAVCARSEKDLQNLATQWQKEFPQSQYLIERADLSMKNEVIAFAEKVVNRFSEITVLVNNAGVFFPGNLSDEPDGHLEKLMEVNLYSAYHLTRCLLPSMKEKKSGHIFNISSIAALRAYENGGAYSITKYALLGFSDNLRFELQQEGIKVTAVMPGATWTRSWESSGLEKERFMLPEDVAAMIMAAYRLSPSANVDHLVIRPLKGDI